LLSSIHPPDFQQHSPTPGIEEDAGAKLEEITQPAADKPVTGQDNR
jgi:hypothetical protein